MAATNGIFCLNSDKKTLSEDKAMFKKLSYNFIQSNNQRIDVDAVRGSALADVFKMCGSAAKAAHAIFHEYCSSLWVFLYSFHNACFWCDCH